MQGRLALLTLRDEHVASVVKFRGPSTNVRMHAVLDLEPDFQSRVLARAPIDELLEAGEQGLAEAVFLGHLKRKKTVNTILKTVRQSFTGELSSL